MKFLLNDNDINNNIYNNNNTNYWSIYKIFDKAKRYIRREYI